MVPAFTSDGVSYFNISQLRRGEAKIGEAPVIASSPAILPSPNQTGDTEQSGRWQGRTVSDFLRYNIPPFGEKSSGKAGSTDENGVVRSDTEGAGEARLAVNGNKKTGELFTVFRDLARGSRLDDYKPSEAAVRQSIDNIASLDPNVKADLLKVFDVWASKKRTPWGAYPVTPQTLVTDIQAAGFYVRGEEKEVWRRPASHSKQLSLMDSTVNTNAIQQATSRTKDAASVDKVAGAAVLAMSCHLCAVDVAVSRIFIHRWPSTR